VVAVVVDYCAVFLLLGQEVVDRFLGAAADLFEVRVFGVGPGGERGRGQGDGEEGEGEKGAG